MTPTGLPHNLFNAEYYLFVVELWVEALPMG